MNGRSSTVAPFVNFPGCTADAPPDTVASKTPADAGFVRRGTQIRHLARIFTVDNSGIEELNSFRRVSTLNELQSVQPWG